MKTKSKITALLSVIVMLFTQVPQVSFAADTTTDIRAERLSPDTLPDGRVEEKYNVDFEFNYKGFNDDFNQYSWSIVDGALPQGLELKPDSGPTWKPWIQGTPTKAGDYRFTVEGGNRKLNGELVIAARKTYTLEILPNPLEISSNILLNGNEGSSYWSKAYERGNRTVTWSMTLEDGAVLPNGLSINATSGEINWQSPVAGKYNLKITATRGDESVSKVLKLIIEPGNGCTHTSTTKTERKHATCKENGMADYWYCDVCERYFLDAEYTRSTTADGLDKFYTIGYHSDENGDKICDTCKKAMPIFKKVTNEDEITSHGTYLVVSKIGEKYYTLKDINNQGSIDAVEIAKNGDGTFSFPKSDTEFMMLKTEFTAECGSLDAGKPRYGLSTTINGIPYTLSSDDSSGYIYMYSYENSKYGYRMSLLEDGTPAIASVYAQYWSGSDESDESGKGKGSSSSASGILTAFEGTKDGKTERFFSLRTRSAYEEEGFYTGYDEYEFYDENSLKTYPIELYKLAYTGTAGNRNYTLSDTQSIVAIDSQFPVINSVEGKDCSTVGGISEAVKTSYVEEVISGQTEIKGDVSVTTYADINIKSEKGTVSDYGYTNFDSIVYTIIPKIAIKGSSSEDTIKKEIDDKYFDGSEMTVSLCVGDMSPAQIIHHKTDGTKE